MQFFIFTGFCFLYIVSTAFTANTLNIKSIAHQQVDQDILLTVLFYLFPAFPINRALHMLQYQQANKLSEIFRLTIQIVKTQSFDYKYLLASSKHIETCYFALLVNGLLGIASMLIFSIAYNVFVVKISTWIAFIISRIFSRKTNKNNVVNYSETNSINNFETTKFTLRTKILEFSDDLYKPCAIRMKKLYLHKKLFNLNLDIFHGECMGILGHSNSGKSDIFRIISGQIAPTSGYASIYRRKPYRMPFRFGLDAGFMDQKYSFFEELTGFENLNFAAQMRNLTGKKKKNRIHAIFSDLQITDDMLLAPVKQLSAGTRQVLAFGMTVIGDPKVIVLDNPTRGLAPKQVRPIWAYLKKYKEQRDKTIVLLTDNITEAELLADRITTLRNGKFVNCGDLTQLNEFYEEFYLITFQCPPSNDKSLGELLSEITPEVQLLYKYQNYKRYAMQAKNLRLSKLFNLITKNSAQLKISSWHASLLSFKFWYSMMEQRYNI